VTITSESLQPKPAIPFSGSFYSSVPTLQSVLEPKTPIFLIIRHSPGTLVALTYIPSNAGVRAKTLFAATRSTLARELGSEKFATTVFATEEEEIVTEQAWRERDLEGNGSPQAGYEREELMDDKERELDAVRRAEEEARHGTAGRDVGTGGTLGRVSGYATGGSVDMPMPVDEDVKSSLRSIQDGQLVQLVGSGHWYYYYILCILTSSTVYRCPFRNRQTCQCRFKCLSQCCGFQAIGFRAAIQLLPLPRI
jgi:twinfilin-like protein